MRSDDCRRITRPVTPEPAVESPPVPPAAPRPRRRLPALLLLGTVLLGLGVLIGTRLPGWVRGPDAPRPDGPQPIAGQPADTAPAVSAKLYIPRKPARLFPESAPAATAEEFDGFRQTQAEIITSRLVLNAAIRPAEVRNLPTLQAHPDPIEWLAAALRVDFPAPEVMRVGLDGENTDDLRVLVDAVVGAYLRDVVNKETAERADRLKRLNEMAAGMEESLKRKRYALRVLATGLGDAKAEPPARPADPEAEAIRFDIRQAEEMLAKVRQMVAVLTIEQDAPPRVMLLEKATARGTK